MDEIIYPADKKANFKITHVTLNTRTNMKLLRVFEIDPFNNKKRYIRNVVIMFENEIVSSVLADINQLREEIASFDQGDLLNHFFQISQINANNKKLKKTSANNSAERIPENDKKVIKTLSYEFKNGNAIHLTKSECRGILRSWNMALEGFTFSRLSEHPLELSLYSLSDLLHENGYI
ncbi:hypothetical protein [Sulfuricurvum sp.]|uniref:hypothetical protein n=1 Tax=Sulfuricurvum sp. TaxID=2025608 RepID=UPI0026100C58|nr:hypothetical protein [Sulfuricurvum sp.]MDD3594867.1 hypothetical protein [Sulfuricurvum sp.]